MSSKTESSRTELSVSVEGLQTYLHCSRQYEFAHVHRMRGTGKENPETARLALLKTVICDALRSSASTAEAFEQAALERFETLWVDHDERFHSATQRQHERRVLESTVQAYATAFVPAHASGLEALRVGSSEDDGNVVGPDLPLSSPRSSSEDTLSNASIDVTATVDYAYLEGSSLIGVRFVPTIRPLGLLRYRDAWEGDVATAFTEHFDAEEDRFEPTLVGTLFETAVVIDGLRALRKRLALEDVRTCRYVQIPVLDQRQLAINWLQQTVAVTLETLDLTTRYFDHHTFGMTHEHRNTTVDQQLDTVVNSLVTDSFAPSEQWDRISRETCPECPYAVCCTEYIENEVRFDG